MYMMQQEEGISEVYRLYGLGLADYGMCHALPMMIPALFFVLKNKATAANRWMCIVGIVVCVLLSWMSESTTALLLSTMTLIFGFMTNSRSSKSGLILVFVLFIPFIISEQLQIGVLDLLNSLLGEDTTFSEKIFEMKYSIIHDEMTGDMGSRMEKYSTSLNLFFEHPLFGSSGIVGMHSAILDRLATFGLFGFIPLALYFFLFLKKIYIQYIPDKGKLFYLESVLAGLIMLLAKNMWLWVMFYFMFIIIPFMFVYDFKKK